MPTTPYMNSRQKHGIAGTNDNHLPWLDGLRGGAALWVLLSHVQILSGAPSIPVLSWGELAVDLFMMLSGFLMAHHYILRQSREPWEHPATFLVFWTRRFFRIAPLYYVLLVVALLLGPWLGDFRSAIALVWPATATSLERYSDQSLGNIVAHASFAFGFLPHFAFRTPLPDWSIGLEMQFYLAFPAIMLLVARIGPVKASLILAGTCLALRALLPDFFQQFQMPAFLPMKLYVFLIGIWIAVARSQESMQRGFLVALGLAMLWLGLERNALSVARVLLVFLLFYLMDNGTLPVTRRLAGGVHWIRARLSGRISRFLGDASYAIYLLHLIVVLPVAGELSRHPGYQGLHPAMRFGICLLVSLPMVFAIAWLLHRFIEQGGIRIGKSIVRAMQRRSNRSIDLPDSGRRIAEGSDGP